MQVAEKGVKKQLAVEEERQIHEEMEQKRLAALQEADVSLARITNIFVLGLGLLKKETGPGDSL